MNSHEFFDLDYGMELDIEVTPEITVTEKNLKRLKPEFRECYFEGEKNLKFFKFYSLENCEIECMTNFTFSACNCTQIDQPYNKARKILICELFTGFLLQDCQSNVKADLLASENFSIEKNCSCYPTCDSLNYRLKYFTKYSNGNETIVNVRLNTDGIISYRRYQQFSFSDIVSYVGGLLGLFAGISMLSICEIFYFVIFRGIREIL